MLRFLLDTNVLSEPVRPRPDSGVLAALEDHDGAIATTTVVWHELLYGTLRLPASRRRSLLLSYLDGLSQRGLPILAYDRAAAEWHARTRAELEAKGRVLPLGDGQIAAVAATQDLVVVTRNRVHFEGLPGVTVVSWFAD